MSPYTFAELMREHGGERGQWRIEVGRRAITATHKTATYRGEPVSFEEPDPEPLHEQLAEWEARNARQRRPGGSQ